MLSVTNSVFVREPPVGLIPVWGLFLWVKFLRASSLPG